MTRDKEKDAEWRKTKNTRLVADIDKETAAEFKAWLKAREYPYQAWLKDQIARALKSK